MRSVLVATAILLSACAGSAARSGDACTTAITVSPVGEDALTAHYQLCAPVTAYALEPYNTPQRSDDWAAAGDDYAFNGASVRRADGATFSEFTLRLRADTSFHDRHYVAADRVGAGWSLLLQALAPEHGSATLQFTDFARDDVLFAEGGVRRASGPRLQLDQDSENIIYVGPRSNIRAGSITVIAGDDIPDWLRERFIRETGTAIDRLSARFGRDAPAPTLIVTSALQGRGSGLKAGTVADGVVEIRLRGIELREGDTALSESLTNTATHEATHFWLGQLWRAARNNEEPWLHEGGAEYLASRIWQTPEGLREEASQRLNGCLLRANGHPMDGSEGPVRGIAPYDCGFVIMLAAETASLRAGHGDIFDLWRAVLDASGPEGFTPTAFLAEARARGGEDFSHVANLVLSAASNPALATIAEPLAAVGIVTAPREAGAGEAYPLLARSLMPVMAQLCGAGGRSYGYNSEPDRIILDTEQSCGPELAGNPAVVSVNGASLTLRPSLAYEAIRAACESRSALRFTTVDGRVLAPVTCTTQIAPAPTIYGVISIPAFPPA